MQHRCYPFLAALIVTVATVLQAHPGHDHVHGLAHGFAHPLLGFDHLLAMVAVGLWAAQQGGRAVWALPSVFIVGMVLGGVIGFAGFPLLAVETTIMLSVIALGLLVASASRFSLRAGLALTALFALMHGHAHGSELVAGDGAAAYAAGFVAATALLHAAGVVFAFSMRQFSMTQWVRYGGGAIAAAGFAMFAGLM